MAAVPQQAFAQVCCAEQAGLAFAKCQKCLTGQEYLEVGTLSLC